MIKKIYILIIVTIILYSCGKKGDPVYRGENQSSDKFSTKMIVFS